MVRKLISAFYEFAHFVLPIGTKIELYRAAKKYLTQNDVDAIIATGDPFILFKYASQLSEKYSIPWIADYRDTWIEDIEMKNSVFKAWCGSLSENT